MKFTVYADLARELTQAERSAVAVALDECVPDSGCVGKQKGGHDEVCFAVEAESDEEGQTMARRYMESVLQVASLKTEYSLHLQKCT